MTVALPPAPEFGAPIRLGRTPEVLEFLALRRSTSAVTLAEPGPSKADLDVLLRLATRVPDHGKLSPWRFMVLEGEAKTVFAARLEGLAQGRGDAQAAAKLGKLKIPPLAVVVISSPKPGVIPEWEQLLSAGAVCTTLLYAALALGYGANWITDWYSTDEDAKAAAGVAADERVAGYIYIGQSCEPPQERARPNIDDLITRL